MLDRNNPKPLYIQLEDILRTHIANGEWQPSQVIPSENELSKEYGISRMTVRSVITTLVKEGLLYRVQGKGTFVSTPKISARSPAYVGVREQLETQGYTINTKLVTFETIAASKKIGQLLNLPPFSDVLYIKRVRYADDEPVSIHESYIPKHLCTDFTHEKMQHEQLCNLLREHYNLTADSVHETLESILATDNEAKLLDIQKGYPLLLLKETSKTISGIVYEYSKIVFRGDKICLEFDYEKLGTGES